MKKMDVMKIIKSLEESGLLIKDVNDTMYESKKQQGGFCIMLLVTLGASSLGNMLAEKRAIAAKVGKLTITAGTITKVQLEQAKFFNDVSSSKQF